MTTSIGEILKRAREKRRLTVDDVYKSIKIHPTFIKALENDEHSAFSSKVHSKGFLKIYSDFLNLPQEEMLALWRREYEQEFDVREKNRELPKKFIESVPFVITPSSVFAVLISVVVIGFFGYLYFQYKHFTGSPFLEINYPPDNLVTSNDILNITGKTDLDSEVFLNNQKIIIGPDGSFADSVRLKEGLNTLSIKSVNKLDKQTEYIRAVIFKPERKNVVEESSSSQTTPSAEQLP